MPMVRLKHCACSSSTREDLSANNEKKERKKRRRETRQENKSKNTKKKTKKTDRVWAGWADHNSEQSIPAHDFCNGMRQIALRPLSLKEAPEVEPGLRKTCLFPTDKARVMEEVGMEELRVVGNALLVVDASQHLILSRYEACALEMAF